MWQLIAGLRDQRVTVILTTHYIEEAQEMADRVGVIDHGALKLVEEKQAFMERLGRTEARITLAGSLHELPAVLAAFPLHLSNDGRLLCYRTSGEGERNGIAPLIKALVGAGIDFTGIEIRESSLEDIFVDLVGYNSRGRAA
jgi:ABC-2 type transport system ATP-binding protein